MEANLNFIEPLIERAEQYGKTSFEVLKLKSIDKAADVIATLISRLLLTIVLSIFLFTLNVAIALWIGDYFGKYYYGFLIVTLFYGLCGIILLFTHPSIKARLNSSIITQMLN